MSSCSTRAAAGNRCSPLRPMRALQRCPTSIARQSCCCGHGRAWSPGAPRQKPPHQHQNAMMTIARATWVRRSLVHATNSRLPESYAQRRRSLVAVAFGAQRPSSGGRPERTNKAMVLQIALPRRVKGVKEVVSGYAGGCERNPTYEQVGGQSEHASRCAN